MFISDLLDTVNRKKRNQVRGRAAVKFAIGMGIAAAVGLAKGILYAPKAGVETRAELKEKAAAMVEALKIKAKTKAAKLLKDVTTRLPSEPEKTTSHKSKEEKLDS